MPRRTDVRQAAEYASVHHGVLTRREADELGLSKNDIVGLVRDGVMEPCGRRSVRFLDHPVTWRQRLYVATVGSRLMSSHTSGAALHRVEGYELPAMLEVTGPPGARARFDDVVYHQSKQMDPDDIFVVDLIPCATLARTVCDLSQNASTDIVRVLDDVQRRGVSLRWLLRTANRLLFGGHPMRSDLPAMMNRRLERYAVQNRSWAGCCRSA